MRIAITGHRHGLGQSIFNKLTYYNKANQHEVIGFDIEDGYDISNRQVIGKVLYNIKDYDVFINNAYHPTGQTEVLKFLLKLWKDQNKILINIGSFLINVNEPDDVTEDHQIYFNEKRKQLSLIKEFYGPLKIIQVNPGFMQTEFLNKMEAPWQLSPEYCLQTIDVADVIVYALEMLEKNIYIPVIDLLDKR